MTSNVHEIPLAFPAVTVCPNNFIHCTNLYEYIQNGCQNCTVKKRDVLCQIYRLGHCQTVLVTKQTFEYGPDAELPEITVCGGDIYDRVENLPSGDITAFMLMVTMGNYLSKSNLPI